MASEEGGTRPLSPTELARALAELSPARTAAKSEGAVPSELVSAIAEVFPEPARARLLAVANALRASDARVVIAACDELVRTVADGPDAALRVMALGVPGPEWIRFRAHVNDARARQDVARGAAEKCFELTLSLLVRAYPAPPR